jgi:hypothetical protein
MANGGLSGLSEVELQIGTDKDGEVGVILTAQLLELFLNLLGEAATVHLIEGVPLRIEVKAEPGTPEMSISGTSTNYFGPFEDILLEADRLRSVSERLEILADKHAGIEELMSVAGSIRNIAGVLDVFTVIRSNAGRSQDDALTPQESGYLD